MVFSNLNTITHFPSWKIRPSLKDFLVCFLASKHLILPHPILHSKVSLEKNNKLHIKCEKNASNTGIQN